ncbi:MAG: sigma 54-interacting transcriptional regulator [Deltaproteobacteria bacterium]|nr:sigma 54-interacting transcriptional regulator [Deltaproteobacteria bacterium]MCB9787787.1 sigma 54-interacting transcriptional regulator [Deltaproteobacteria bacterium]
MSATLSARPAETPPPKRGPLLDSANPAMQRVLMLGRGVAATPATVLLTGESGTGKEVLARWIHQLSPRARFPFVAVNCGAMPATLVESELFGHERGAFSGATERRVGRFEAAHRGTLLLDEISEMPLALQTRLLRVLQEREIQRVGGTAPIAIDVRVVATTNRDLRRMVADGSFREDLYYRLNVFPIHLPPLRERMEDLPALVEAILARLAPRFGHDACRVSRDALSALAAASWPGNVRELANVLERGVVLAPGGCIGTEHLVIDAPMESVGARREGTRPAASETLEDLERQTILQVLDGCGGNRTHAAEQLGISIRTLRNRLRAYRERGVEVPEPASGVPLARAGGPAISRMTTGGSDATHRG